MHETMQKEGPDRKGEFREQRRRKRIPSAEKTQAKRSRITRDPKILPQVAVTRDPRIPSQVEVPTRNFFAPLKTADMELESYENTSNQADDGEQQPQQTPSSQRSRPPPIILTSAAKLIQLQKKLKGLVKDNFEFQILELEPQLLPKKGRTFQPSKST
jgi:hypothetical protein